jgi:hypothetical protein
MGIAPWDLLDRPSYWQRMGLGAMNAEGEARSHRSS